MQEIRITGDITRQALQDLINKAIESYGKELSIIISPNLDFEKTKPNNPLNKDEEVKMIEKIETKLRSFLTSEKEKINEIIDKVNQLDKGIIANPNNLDISDWKGEGKEISKVLDQLETNPLHKSKEDVRTG